MSANNELQELIDSLRTAIASAEASASQPAPDEQREKAIEAWRLRMVETFNRFGWTRAQWARDINEAIALMRSAPPAPAVLYSCPACGAEMDSSRCWCCGWSNK